MPISVQTPIIEHVPNGVTTVFAYPFAILDAEDLKAQLDGAPFTAFTVSGVGSRTGGSITCTSAPTGSSLILYREISLARATDYQELGDLLAETLDDDFDRVWMAVQDLGATSERSMRVPVGETLPILPESSSRAERVLGFDSNGDPIMVTRTEDGGAALGLDLASSAGASLIGFLQSGVGAVARTLQSKARDTVSVKDFGAVGDGVTDDTAAFATALASGAMRIYVPYTGSQYVITGALSVPRGVTLIGDTFDQPGILCKTATAGDIVFFSVTGNTQLENLRIYCDSATSGTLVSLTGGTYSFTGNIRLRNVRLYLAKVGLFINSIFNARVDGCEFRGCKRGVDASPLTDGGDNGYINAVTFSQCYWGTNTDYDVYANPAVRVSVLSFNDCTFDPGPTVAKVYLKNANPCSFRDSYFEGGSAAPAIKGTLSTVTVETSYFIGTKGIEYDNTQASLVMRQCRTGSSTDIVNAGYTLHTLRILDTTLPASGNVFDSKSVKYFDNATINGTTYNLVRNESATFTPTLTGTGGTSAHTYVWQTGYYTRIGNSVHFHAVVRVSALDAGMTGTVRVNLAGLPTSQNVTLNNVVCNVALQSVTLSASRTHAFGRIDLNTNIVEIYEEGSNVTASLMPVGNLTAGTHIWVSGHYLVTPGT